MTRQYGAIWELEIGRDEDIKSSISEFFRSQGWDQACICGAVGSVKEVTLTTPVSFDLPPAVTKTPFTGPGEVLAFSGEVMKSDLMDPLLKEIYKGDEDLFIHIHISLAGGGAHVYGGGLDKGKTFRGLKVFIAR